MDAFTLAETLLGQLQQTADIRSLSNVTCVRMVVGAGYEVAAAELAECFTRVYAGTGFDGARTDVRIIEAGQTFLPPGSDEPIAANRFEIFILELEGESGTKRS